jgi:hypothetical protein
MYILFTDSDSSFSFTWLILCLICSSMLSLYILAHIWFVCRVLLLLFLARCLVWFGLICRITYLLPGCYWLCPHFAILPCPYLVWFSGFFFSCTWLQCLVWFGLICRMQFVLPSLRYPTLLIFGLFSGSLLLLHVG